MPVIELGLEPEPAASDTQRTPNKSNFPRWRSFLLPAARASPALSASPPLEPHGRDVRGEDVFEPAAPPSFAQQQQQQGAGHAAVAARAVSPPGPSCLGGVGVGGGDPEAGVLSCPVSPLGGGHHRHHYEGPHPRSMRRSIGAPPGGTSARRKLEYLQRQQSLEGRASDPGGSPQQQPAAPTMMRAVDTRSLRLQATSWDLEKAEAEGEWGNSEGESEPLWVRLMDGRALGPEGLEELLAAAALAAHEQQGVAAAPAPGAMRPWGARLLGLSALARRRGSPYATSSARTLAAAQQLLVRLGQRDPAALPAWPLPPPAPPGHVTFRQVRRMRARGRRGVRAQLMMVDIPLMGECQRCP